MSEIKTAEEMLVVPVSYVIEEINKLKKLNRAAYDDDEFDVHNWENQGRYKQLQHLLSEYKSQSLPVENNNEVVYKWVKADLENFTNIPADETELFIKCEDAEGIISNAHGWIDTIDGNKRIRWDKEPAYPGRGGYALMYMKSLEFLEEIKPVPQSK